MLSWAIDPGYRTGCKMAIIDQQGNVLDYGAYYLTNSEKLRKEAQKVLADKSVGLRLLFYLSVMVLHPMKQSNLRLL